MTIVTVSTGIVENFPTAKTGAIYTSRALADLLRQDLKCAPLPGVIGMFPPTLTTETVGILSDAIAQAPNSLEAVAFRLVNGELVIDLDLAGDVLSVIQQGRWRARVICDTPEYEDGKEHVVGRIRAAKSFWLEPLQEGEPA